MEKRKIKYTIIGALIIVIGILSFFVYQSYAYFKVNYTRNIINTTVGDFRQSYTLASEPLTSPTATSIFWGGPIGRDTIEEISFTTTNEVPTGVIGSWDAGLEKNGKVMAWYTDNDANNKYEVVVGANGGVYAPENSSRLFMYFQNLNSLDLTNLNTSKVIFMSWMFVQAGYNSTIFTLDLGDKFDTSNVTTMYYMFAYVADKSTIFTLDLGDKFDTSNVTTMATMFGATGISSTVFTLDLGDKFDTSNVTTMHWMFYLVGNSNPNFTLDLRNFNINSVVNTDNNVLATLNTSHKIYVSTSNIDFMSNPNNKFTGTIINCTTTPAYCP